MKTFSHGAKNHFFPLFCILLQNVVIKYKRISIKSIFLLFALLSTIGITHGKSIESNALFPFFVFLAIFNVERGQ